MIQAVIAFRSITSYLFIQLCIYNALVPSHCGLARGAGLEYLPCAKESGRNSGRHSAVLDALDGERLVFVGDSISRYQYLELAWYISHGTCPERGSPSYTLQSEHDAGTWPDFFYQTSELLSIRAPDFVSSEVCYGSRPHNELTPGSCQEYRVFEYHDRQGRAVTIWYLNYFNEEHAPLAAKLATAGALAPTRAYLAFGAWFTMNHAEPLQSGSSDNVCGREPEKCPDPTLVCAALRRGVGGAPLLWQTPTPWALLDSQPNILLHGTLLPVAPVGDRLNMASACALAPEQVIDRNATISALAPDPWSRHRLFWYGPHVHAEANHAFNADLVARLPSARSGAVSRGARRFQGLWSPAATLWRRIIVARAGTHT